MHHVYTALEAAASHYDGSHDIRQDRLGLVRLAPVGVGGAAGAGGIDDVSGFDFVEGSAGRASNLSMYVSSWREVGWMFANLSTSSRRSILMVSETVKSSPCCSSRVLSRPAIHPLPVMLVNADAIPRSTSISLPKIRNLLFLPEVVAIVDIWREDFLVKM